MGQDQRAYRSHKVIFDANDRFISEADVRITTASVSFAHQEVISGELVLPIHWLKAKVHVYH